MDNLNIAPPPYVVRSIPTLSSYGYASWMIDTADGSHEGVAEVYVSREFAEGLVDCVNAFAGIENPKDHMEAMRVMRVDYASLTAKAIIVESQRDELLEALKVCYKSLCTYGSHPIIEKQVELAIKKVTQP